MASVEDLKAQQQLLLQRQQAIQKQGIDPATGQRTSGFSGAGRVLGNIQASIAKEYQRLEREIQQANIIKQRETILAQGGTQQDLQRAGVTPEQQSKFFNQRRPQSLGEIQVRGAVQPREGSSDKTVKEQLGMPPTPGTTSKPQRPLQGLVPGQQRPTNLSSQILKPTTPQGKTQRFTELPSAREKRKEELYVEKVRSKYKEGTPVPQKYLEFGYTGRKHLDELSEQDRILSLPKSEVELKKRTLKKETSPEVVKFDIAPSKLDSSGRIVDGQVKPSPQPLIQEAIQREYGEKKPVVNITYGDYDSSQKVKPTFTQEGRTFKTPTQIGYSEKFFKEAIPKVVSKNPFRPEKEYKGRVIPSELSSYQQGIKDYQTFTTEQDSQTTRLIKEREQQRINDSKSIFQKGKDLINEARNYPYVDTARQFPGKFGTLIESYARVPKNSQLSTQDGKYVSSLSSKQRKLGALDYIQGAELFALEVGLQAREQTKNLFFSLGRGAKTLLLPSKGYLDKTGPQIIREEIGSPDVQNVLITGGLVGGTALLGPVVPTVAGVYFFGSSAKSFVEQPSSETTATVLLTAPGLIEPIARGVRAYKNVKVTFGGPEVPIKEIYKEDLTYLENYQAGKQRFPKAPPGGGIPEIVKQFEKNVVSPKVNVASSTRFTTLGGKGKPVKLSFAELQQPDEGILGGFASKGKNKIVIEERLSAKAQKTVLRHELTHIYDPKIPTSKLGHLFRDIFPERYTNRLKELGKVSGRKKVGEVVDFYKKSQFAREARARIAENIPELLKPTTKIGREVESFYKPFVAKNVGSGKYKLIVGEAGKKFISLKKTPVASYTRGGKLFAYHAATSEFPDVYQTIRGGSPEAGQFFSHVPSINFLRLDSQRGYSISLLPSFELDIPRLIRGQYKEVGRIPADILRKETKGFPLSQAYRESQVGQGKMFISARSEKYYSQKPGGIKDISRKIGGTPESETMAARGEFFKRKTVKQTIEGFRGKTTRQVKAPVPYVKIQGYNIPIETYELLVGKEYQKALKAKGGKGVLSGEEFKEAQRRAEDVVKDYSERTKKTSPYATLGGLPTGSSKYQSRSLSSDYPSFSLSRYEPSRVPKYSLFTPSIKTPSYKPPPKTPSRPPRYPPNRPPKYPPFEPPPSYPPLTPPKYPPSSPPKYPPLVPPPKYPPLKPPKYPPFTPPRTPPPDFPKFRKRKAGEKSRVFEFGSRRPVKYAPSLTGIARNLFIKKTPGGSFAGTELRRIVRGGKRLGLAERLNTKFPKVKL